MNDTYICERCGWDCSTKLSLPSVIEGWPVGLPSPPPLPDDATVHHAQGSCLSPFKIGERLYWSFDDIPGEHPALMVEFKSLAQIECANYALHEGAWVRQSKPRAHIATVSVVTEAIYPAHERLFGDLLKRDLELTVDSLTSVDCWPIYEIS